MPVLASVKTRYGGGSVCSVCLRAEEHVFKQLYSPVLPSSISHQFRQHLLTVCKQVRRRRRGEEGERETEIETDREGERARERERGRRRERETDRQTDRQTDTNRDRQRKTETEKAEEGDGQTDTRD